MTLRTRIALASAVAVAVAVLGVSLAAYLTTRTTLYGQVDRDLEGRVGAALRDLAGPGGRDHYDRFGGPEDGKFGGIGAFRQIIDSSGRIYGPDPQRSLATDEALAVARTGHARAFDVRVSDAHLRVLTAPVGNGLAIQVARPIDEIDRSLGSLRGRLVLVSLAGIVASAILGLLVAARGVRPVSRLTESLEHVARTRDLRHRVEVRGNDEPARLGRTFNEMLESLDRARSAQEQLVADASHELRTPLAALRTNAELLASGADIPAGERRTIAADVASQIDDFGRLVADLVELTRGERPAPHPEPLRLDELVEDAVARARVLHPGIEFTVAASPSTVVGDTALVERAVANLLDNAVTHGRPPVEVDVADGAVTVRDHGDGVREDDRPRVFARFWRADDARGRRGSGLGLAIVQQVAQAHGGSVEVENAPTGGAVFRLRFPTETPARGG